MAHEWERIGIRWSVKDAKAMLQTQFGAKQTSDPSGDSSELERELQWGLEHEFRLVGLSPPYAVRFLHSLAGGKAPFRAAEQPAGTC